MPIACCYRHASYVTVRVAPASSDKLTVEALILVPARCTVKCPSGQLPPPRSDAPCFLPLRSKAPWIKRPRSNAPFGQTTLPVSDRESMYSVYYVIIVTGIGAMLLKNTKNDIMQLKLWCSRDITNKTIKRCNANEQGFLTPGVFSCNAFSFRSCPVTSAPFRVPPRERTAAGRGAC